MKVLFVTSQVITRHATMKRAAGMAPSLTERGWSVGVLAEDHPDNRAYFGAVPGLKTFYYPATGMLAERACKNRFVQTGGWNLVHVCGLGWRNAISRKGPAFVVMDHVELESSLTGTPLPRRLLQGVLEKTSRRYYRGAIGASKWLCEWLSRGSRGPVQYLPYGAERPRSVAPEARARFLATKELGRYVLYCGGMYSNYGFWTMLEAFLRLAGNHKDFSAILLGRGPEKERGMQRVAAEGLQHRIRFPGYVPEEELDLYLSGAAVHVSPLNDTITDRARCPSKIPLYIMTGRPIVTCRIGEGWEYLRELGHYYQPGNPDSLETVLRRIWSEPEEKPVPYDLEKFSWPYLAGQYAEFWMQGDGQCRTR